MANETQLGLIAASWIGYLTGILVYTMPILQAGSFFFAALASFSVFLVHLKKFFNTKNNEDSN